MPWTLLRNSVQNLHYHIVRGCCLKKSSHSSLFTLLTTFTDLVLTMHRSHSLYSVASSQIGTRLDFYDYDVAMRELFGIFNRERTGHPFVTEHLLRLLYNYRRRQATEPRDKIYAVFPLAKWKPVSQIVASDYSQNFLQVYTDVARIIISKSRYLDILAIASSISGHPDLPSWVPDWGSHNNLNDSLRIISLEGYRATLDEYAKVEFEHSILIVKAAMLSEIKSCRRGMIRNRPLWKTIYQWTNMMQTYNHNFQPKQSLCGIKWADFCRALYGDIIFPDGSKRMLRLSTNIDGTKRQLKDPLDQDGK